MPIYIKKSVEPGSPAANTEKIILANSDVARQLKGIVRRYVEGEVTGRSFLISGHRGAGKTTLVKKVIEEVKEDVGNRGLRPLLVAMSGPMLLPPDGSNKSADETKAVLEQLTVNLYRALAREFANCYLDSIRPTPTNPFTGFSRQSPDNSLEIAEAFRLKLDGYAELAELRAFWQEARALETGILFRSQRKFNQGTSEIAALWSCQRAYLSLAADYNQESGSTETDTQKSELSAKTSDKGLISALVSAGSGSAVGAALLTTNQSPLLAAFSAVLTAVAAAVILNFSFSRSRESTNRTGSTVKIKYDMQSLARELPELLQRCRDAGIVPIFLIDELDKVEHLEKRMESLIFSTKLLVTEQSVFFFVTDREYYEYIEQRSRTVAYPREHTFFSERMFVSYRPGDWRQYFKDLLTPGSADPAAQAEEKEAIEILSFVLLCRSRMHAIDLRRALGRIAAAPQAQVREDVEYEVDITAKQLVEERRFLLEVLMQVAVEVTLNDDRDFLARCTSEPPFTQIAYDTLYYLGRTWEAAPQNRFKMIEDDFGDWLANRSPGLTRSNDNTEVPYLFQKARAVLFRLQFPERLANEALIKELYLPKVIGMVRAAPALVVCVAAGEFEWQFDPFGRPLHPATVEKILEDQQLEADIEMLRAVAAAIKENTHDMIGFSKIQSAGLLAATPPVSAVFQALDRLTNLKKNSNPVAYAQMDDDAANVRLFASEVTNRSQDIARSIVTTWLLSRASTRSEPPARLDIAWAALAERITWKSAPPDQVCEFARRLFYTFQQMHAPQDKPYLADVGLRQYDYSSWSDSLKAAIDRITTESFEDKFHWDEIEASAWSGWAKASLAFLQQKPFAYGEISNTTPNEILARVHESSTLHVFKPDLATMSIADWSALAVPILAPPWATPVALTALGFREDAASLLQAAAPISPLFPAELAREVRNRFAQRSPVSHSVLIVRAQQNSITNNWIPETTYSALSISRPQLIVVSVNFATPFEYILVELEPTDDIDNWHGPAPQLPLNLPSNIFDPEKTQLGLITSQPQSIPSPSISLVAAPVGLSDAVGRLISLERARAPRAPAAPG